MQKLTHQLAGELGETLALAKFISVGLQAYISPAGAPGYDIMVVTQEGLKSVEVKTRQYIDRASDLPHLTRQPPTGTGKTQGACVYAAWSPGGTGEKRETAIGLAV